MLEIQCLNIGNTISGYLPEVVSADCINQNKFYSKKLSKSSEFTPFYGTSRGNSSSEFAGNLKNVKLLNQIDFCVTFRKK